ncbi:hypothetical protein Tco_0840493 [Tanacetum coccineum]|uniref:Transposase (Putative), gypsy type n=1 Tax=Tanacetum coccineum TaxID=301880 RepID=A0ABQ5AY17_9ASTR
MRRVNTCLDLSVYGFSFVVIGVAKVSHFEIMCRAFGRIPTVGTFRRFYVNSISNGWLSFLKRGDASVCPLSTSWFGGTSIVKDPLPVDEAVDLPFVELLNENQMSLLDFVKSANPFKVKVGERTLAENEVPLITETEDRVISPSPQIISLVDHTIQDELNVNSGKRNKRAAFVYGSPPVKKAQTEGIVISDSRPSTAGKSPTALQRLIRQGEQASAGSGSAAPATKDATSSSVTPTLEHALEDSLHDNVRTLPPTGRFFVLSSSSADTDITVASQVVSLVSSSHAGVSVPATESAGDGHPLSAPEFETGTLSATPSHGSSADDIYESQTVESTTAMNVYVPNWNVTNNGRVDDPINFHSLLDNVTPPGYWAALRNQSDIGFLNAFNINFAQHICIAYELRLRYEHEIVTREKFEKKFTDSVAVVQQMDAEVAELKVKLEKSESEVTEVGELRKRVSDLEALAAVKAGEVASLTTQNAGLLEKVSVVELESDSLKIQVVSEGKMRE